MHLETVALESKELFIWEPGIESPTFAPVNLIVGLFGVSLCYQICAHNLSVVQLFAAICKI